MQNTNSKVRKYVDGTIRVYYGPVVGRAVLSFPHDQGRAVEKLFLQDLQNILFLKLEVSY